MTVYEGGAGGPERVVEEDAEERTGQTFPYPWTLQHLVEKATYREGWRLTLVDDYEREEGKSRGLTFIVTTLVKNSYRPEQEMRVNHLFPVPPATFNEESWKRWMLSRLIEVETHEACEFFRIGGEVPFAPHHGPGNDPYIIFHQGSDVERRTSFRGDVKERVEVDPQEN